MPKIRRQCRAIKLLLDFRKKSLLYSRDSKNGTLMDDLGSSLGRLWGRPIKIVLVGPRSALLF